jgi:asparagine synthase (glutamine-hydrolysing)
MLIVCGIVGSIDLAGGTGRREWVEPLLPSLAHRGPDDQRVETSGPVAFGHTRLSIVGVDKPHARQPFSIERNLLNFNGEIYNFQDVLRRLKADRIPMRGGSDTEAIGACLHHWGVEHTLASIDGMFAFAWYNSDERSLTLSRDPLGEKPLYWTRKGNRLWFASEIKALLLTGEISDESNLARIDDYLYPAKDKRAGNYFCRCKRGGTWHLRYLSL